MTNKKKVRLSLYHVGYGLWNFLKAFENKALEDGWSQEEVTNLMDKAFLQTDYMIIHRTVINHCIITRMQKGIRLK